MEEKNCIIYYNSASGRFYDSRQYDDICNGIWEKYFYNAKFGADQYADINIIYSSYWNYRDERAKKCIDVYYDENIEQFLENIEWEKYMEKKARILWK